MFTFGGCVHFCTLHVQCTKLFGKIGPSTTSTNSSMMMYTACAVYKIVHCTCSVHFVYILAFFWLTSGTQMSNDLPPPSGRAGASSSPPRLLPSSLSAQIPLLGNATKAEGKAKNEEVGCRRQSSSSNAHQRGHRRNRRPICQLHRRRLGRAF